MRAPAAIVLCAVAALGISLTGGKEASAATLLVPSQYATIQSAVDAATPGSTVLVSPGTYVEHVDFSGKSITVESTGGAAVTTIDGGGAGPVVTFESSESRLAVLRGFTITGGEGGLGAGIYIFGASPTIEENVLTGNSGCNGSAIGVIGDTLGPPRSSAAVLRNNTIAGNSAGTGCGSPAFGAIMLFYARDTEITRNLIEANAGARGGGLSSWRAFAIVRDNVIRNNTATQAGGGAYVSDWTVLTFENNVVTGNSAPSGAGVYVQFDRAPSSVEVANNVIALNAGEQIRANLPEDRSNLNIRNNLLMADAGGVGIACTLDLDADSSVAVRHNDVYAPTGTPFSGNCAGGTGIDGNISVDPVVVDAPNGDFHAVAGSPLIDGGDALGSSAADVDGIARPQDGNGDAIAVADIGVYEVLSADGDGDLMSDADEAAHACLGGGSADAAGDPDGDGLTSFVELGIDTDPCAADSDGDGCSDGEETAADERLGGQRDPLYAPDFFDTTGDGSIDLTDSLDILQHFGYARGTPEAMPRDRSQDPWRSWITVQDNTGIDLTDVLVNLGSYGHGCGT